MRRLSAILIHKIRNKGMCFLYSCSHVWNKGNSNMVTTRLRELKCDQLVPQQNGFQQNLQESTKFLPSKTIVSSASALFSYLWVRSSLIHRHSKWSSSKWKLYYRYITTNHPGHSPFNWNIQHKFQNYLINHVNLGVFWVIPFQPSVFTRIHTIDFLAGYKSKAQTSMSI